MKKKILFWINSGTMNIFGLAKYLQNDIDAEFFAIYDVTDKPKKFFQEQKLTNFQKIWFYHDFMQKKITQPDLNYLKGFEDKYRINLWKLASTERIFLYNEFYKFSTEEMISILEQECRFFENTIDEIKPDFVIMVRPYFHHDTIFFQLCKAKGIKVLELDTTRFPNRSIVGLNEKKDGYENFEISGKIRSFEELQEYRKRNSSFKQNVDFESTNRDFVSTGLDYIFSKNENIKTHYTYFGRNKIKVLINYVYDFFKKRYRKKFVDKYSFNYTMLCDESHEMLENYGVWGLKKFMGREYMGISRVTYILDKNHIIKEVIEKVNTKSHACDILEMI